MHRKNIDWIVRFGLAFVASLAIALPFHCHGDDRPDETADALLTRLEAISQCVLEHHLNAPTASSMYLAATRAMYRSQGHLPPQDLGLQFSAVSSQPQLRSLFRKHWGQVTGQGTQSQATLATAALNGMLNSAGLDHQFDPLAEQDRVEKQLSENQYIGIGIAIGMDDQYSKITNPIIGGPAHRAGAKAGDLILEIDGKSTDGWNLGKVVTELRGPIESKVSVVVRNKVDGDQRTLDMVRTTVPIPSVHGVKQNDDESWQIAFPEYDQIAYFRMSDIVGSTAAEFLKFGLLAERENAKAVVLDFRGANRQPPELHHALLVADSLVGEMNVGKIHFRDRVRDVSTQSENALGELPVVVIADAQVQGPLGIVLAALRNRPGTQFVGSGPIRSRFQCTERIALPNQQGAIRAMPVGQFVFQSNKTGVADGFSDAPAELPFSPAALPVDHVVTGRGARQSPAPHVTRFEDSLKPDYLVLKAIEVANQMASRP